MNKSIEAIAKIICSLGAVIFVLLMTIIGMIFLSHGLYYQILSRTMEPWQAEVASWVLACGIETTVLIVTSNVKFLSPKLPVFFAICSGLIVLFFIQAFDASQSMLDISMRWFLGLMVGALNFTYSSLFVQKYQEGIEQRNLNLEMTDLKLRCDAQSRELAKAKQELVKAKIDFDHLFVYSEELETFKSKEEESRRCPYCGEIFGNPFNPYKLTSHKGVCQQNPRKGLKQSVFEEV